MIDKRLDLWLNEQRAEEFPLGNDYLARYSQVATYLKNHVHTEVEKSAIFNEIKKNKIPPEKVTYLNNHGLGHVDHVIVRVSELLKEKSIPLSPYEAYILLMAIQFHDVGNIYGRRLHEKKCSEVMAAIGSVAGDDTCEKQTIINIAASHGGCYNGDKDTIGPLEPQSVILGKPIRPRFLAALLRFADELADDRSRVSRFLLSEGQIPEHSKIFHAYSFCLHSVWITKDSIDLSYELTKKYVNKKLGKLNKKTYLLDEIYARTWKMHLERLYCMRFLRSDIAAINKIQVNIVVYPDLVPEGKPQSFLNTLKKINYTLEEKGYPDDSEDGFLELCPEMKGKNGKWLKKELTKRRS